MPVDTPSAGYMEQSQYNWPTMRDVLAGDQAIKAGGSKYVPLPTGYSETDPGYVAYVERPYFLGATSRTSKMLKALLFRKDPDTQYPDMMQPVVDDFTLTGKSLTGFSMQVAQELVDMSYVGIMVDMPPAPETPETRAQAAESNRRPFAIMYKAEEILDTNRGPVNNKLALTQVRLKEMVEEENPEDIYAPAMVEQIKVLDLMPLSADAFPETVPYTPDPVYSIQLYRRAVDKNGDPTDEWVEYGERIIPTLGGLPMQVIPFVAFSWDGVVDQDEIPEPDLLDMAIKNIDHFVTLCDLEQAVHEVAIPVRYIWGILDKDVPTQIGPQALWHSETKDITAGVVEVTGAGIQHIENRERTKKEEMALLGGKVLAPEKKAAETAETARIKGQGEQSQLTNVSVTLSEEISWALEFCYTWMLAGAEAQDEIRVDFNSDFMPVPMDSALLKQLMEGVVGGTMSWETYYYNLQKGELTQPGWTADEEKNAIETNPPVGMGDGGEGGMAA